MLKVENLGFAIGSRQILQGIDAAFLPGRFCLVAGANGAGKTTLLRLLSGQEKPTAGCVTFMDRALSDYSVAELARIRSVLSQHTELSFPMQVGEVVMMGRYAHFLHQPSTKDEQACEDAMRLFGVLELADREYHTLSGGEKQRVQFARVLAQVWYIPETGCRYLLLDEPLTFLDIRFQHDFLKKVSGLLRSQDTILVGVLHDLNLVSEFATDVMLLSEGRVLAFGPPEEVLTPELINTAFGVTPEIFAKDGRRFIFL